MHIHPASHFDSNASEATPASHAITGEDRRRHARYALTLAITMRGDNNFYTGVSEDLSQGGVFIATCTMLPIGTPVVLSFTLMRSLEPIVVGGTVRWVRPPDAVWPIDSNISAHRGGIKPGMGIQFANVDEKSARTIGLFMRRRCPDFFD